MLDVKQAIETEESLDPWRRVLANLAFAMVAWAVILMVVVGEIIPEPAVVGVLVAVAAIMTRRGHGKAGPITLLVLGALVVVLTSPFALPDLAHPDLPLNFAFGAVAGLGLPLAIVVAAIGTLRRWSDQMRTTTWLTTVGVIVVGMVVSLAAAASTTSDVALEGDVTVTAEDVEFTAQVTVASGSGALFIDNRDPGRHTFTIDELGIDVQLPSNTARRVVLGGVEPGTYEYVCAIVGHEKMTGELIVTG